jgi:lysophospholipid acyltransferase (LPLAT)-like uncharacterized protein
MFKKNFSNNNDSLKSYFPSIELWEVKSFIKLCLRKIIYNKIIQVIISFLLFFYLFFVYKTANKKYEGFENIDKLITNNKPIIFVFWHNRLMMIPFIARRIKKKYHKHNLMTLASKHGDGRIVGMVMQRFGLISILGSTKRTVKFDKKLKDIKGIDFATLRLIINGLKNGYALGITPDGPRGPNQQINSEVLNIARITGATIVPISYSCKKFKIIKKSWDQFKVPLPFTNIIFFISQKHFIFDKELGKQDLDSLNHELKKELDLSQDYADKYVSNN